jgi:hypothetical protein
MSRASLQRSELKPTYHYPLQNFGQYYFRDSPNFYILTHYFVLNLITGDMHSFRYLNDTAALQFYPQLVEVSQWFTTVRRDTNGYMKCLLEHIYKAVGFPRSGQASLDQDLLTV